ncbi:MAG: ImmA/IrrE family metallo-endopeptidase [Cyanobacteria bacterium J06634_6]
MSEKVVEFPTYRPEIDKAVSDAEFPENTSGKAEHEEKVLSQTLSMDSLLKKLSAVGLNANYVRRAGLPSWWNDELNEIPAAVLEGTAHIAQRLHLDLKSLLRDDLDAAFKPLLQTNFKYHDQQASDIPQVAFQVASRIAELVALSLPPKPFVPVPAEANRVRQCVLGHGDKVDLGSLLSYCWKNGIAVVYFNDYPPQSRKVTGMIQWQGDRPVILLSHKVTHPAWLAFHLAHELGHLALGHVETGILIDDEINESDDIEESAANRFAVKLLVNQYDNCFQGVPIYNNIQLRKKIEEKLKADPTVDACALAFNYGWHAQKTDPKKFGLAKKAVQFLGCEASGDKIIQQVLENRLDWENLNDDAVDHLERILGD